MPGDFANKEKDFLTLKIQKISQTRQCQGLAKVSKASSEVYGGHYFGKLVAPLSLAHLSRLVGSESSGASLFPAPYIHFS